MNDTFKHSVKANPDQPMALTVTYTGHEKCEASHRWGPGVRPQFILHFIVSGKGTYISPEGSFSLSGGDVFLIRPFTEIEYYADENDPWEYYWVNFMGSDAELLLRLTDLSGAPVMHSDPEQFSDELEKMLLTHGEKSYENIELTGRLYILLSRLAKGSHQVKRHSGTDRCLKTAIDYIAQNYPLNISVDDIAAAAAVSRTTLFRAFRAELGRSPADYLIEYRISKAKQLLKSTDLSVSAVARSAGYEDSAYFSRAFRRLTGFSPTDYREKRRDG